MDGGATFTATVRRPRSPSTIKNVRGFLGRTTYDTEMTQTGRCGRRAAGIGANPRKPDQGEQRGTSSLAGGGAGGAGGGVALNSFFDVYTEVSTDGGLLYSPTTNGPCHMELHRIAPVHTYTNNLLPAFLSDYASQQHAKYGTYFVLTNVIPPRLPPALYAAGCWRERHPHLRLDG